MIVQGHIIETIEAYEAKQQEIADRLGIKERYAGRPNNPDIKMLDGRYFLPDELGLDAMDTSTDVPTFKKNYFEIIE